MKLSNPSSTPLLTQNLFASKALPVAEQKDIKNFEQKPVEKASNDLNRIESLDFLTLVNPND